MLPALPEAWSTGSVAGLRTKGNAEVDLEWEDGQLITATIRAFSSGTVNVHYGEHKVSLAMEAGGIYHINRQLQVREAFSTGASFR